MSVQIEENAFLRFLVRGFSRSPRQLNAFLESDAELIRLDGGLILAVTTDGIVEEIESGLYDDPCLMGWMVVMVNLSDLAASGARPLGILLIENLPASLEPSFIQRIQQGVEDACRQAGTFVLGGDTNASTTLQLCATGIGVIEDENIISRRGSQPSDILYSTGCMGAGNAFAFVRLLGGDAVGAPPYRPAPRLREGCIIRRFGSAAIDTSDGFFAALANLAELNGIGFQLDVPLDEIVGADLASLARGRGIPPWYFLAGPHGEFELLCTVSPGQNEPFIKACRAQGWRPTRLGSVVPDPGLYRAAADEGKEVDLFEISNLFARCGGNPELFFQKLQQISL